MRERIHERIRRNLDVLRTKALAFAALTVLPIEGGWSAVVQVPSFRTEEALVLDLLERDHVLVHPGFFFDFPHEAFLILSLLVEPRVFDAGIERVLLRAASPELVP